MIFGCFPVAERERDKGEPHVLFLLLVLFDAIASRFAPFFVFHVTTVEVVDNFVKHGPDHLTDSLVYLLCSFTFVFSRLTLDLHSKLTQLLNLNLNFLYI